MGLNLEGYIKVQRDWSKDVFGEGKRTGGLIEHIKSELKEIEKNPEDLEEWIDVIILALDGAWRLGASEEQITRALENKQLKNLMREWPMPKSEDEPSFHVKDPKVSSDSGGNMAR